MLRYQLKSYSAQKFKLLRCRITVYIKVSVPVNNLCLNNNKNGGHTLIFLERGEGKKALDTWPNAVFSMFPLCSGIHETSLTSLTILMELIVSSISKLYTISILLYK